MARYFDVHPANPQRRSLNQVADIVRGGGLIAYPTDSGFAFGCRMGNAEGLERIRQIRDLDRHHHFTLVCSSFHQLGQYVEMNNQTFRLVKAHTPGPYTFILEATREVPRRLMNPKRRTIGIRVPDHPVPQLLLQELGEPLMSSTLLLPGDELPMTEAREIQERLFHVVDAVIDGGHCGLEPTTVIDLESGAPVILRRGKGDVSALE